MPKVQPALVLVAEQEVAPATRRQTFSLGHSDCPGMVAPDVLAHPLPVDGEVQKAQLLHMHLVP